MVLPGQRLRTRERSGLRVASGRGGGEMPWSCPAGRPGAAVQAAPDGPSLPCPLSRRRGARAPCLGCLSARMPAAPCTVIIWGMTALPPCASFKGGNSVATTAASIASEGGQPSLADMERRKGAPVAEEAEGGTADVPALALYGILQHRYGRYDDALVACSAAVRACPGYPPAHAGRARALVSLGRPGEALDAFCDAIACDPECAPAYADYALMVTRLGCYEDAVAAYREAIRLAPDSGDVHAGHAFALAGAGRLEDALAACEKATALDPKSGGARAARGRVLAGMGRPEEALSAFDQALGLDGRSASAHAGRGMVLESLGRHAEALSAYERALRLDGGSASAHAGRGMVLESLGRHAEALSAYERAVGIDEHHGLAGAGMDRIERRGSSGSPGEARCAGTDLAMDPDHGSARGYIEYCMSHAPRGDEGQILREGGPRSPPMTAEEAADIKESASSNEAVVMDGSKFVDMVRRWTGTAERAGCGGP